MSGVASNGGEGGSDAAAFAELRRLLTDPERQQIRELLERLDDPEIRAAEVSRVLADAVVRASRDGALGRALAPTVEEALHVSIRRDPQSLADAISPIMGPAIRRSILQAIGGMVQSLNQTVEQSFSAKGLKWRLEAMRSGRPFGEVVALKTLRFQVERVFLIHRNTGLLLAHRSVWPSTDPDLIGSMLVAIRDFVSDSFDDDVDSGGTLDSIQVGDRTLWIETGRDAIIAGLVRGAAPNDLRETLTVSLEQIEVSFGEQLAEFDGDDEGLTEAGVFLGECLRSQGIEPEESQGPSRGAVLGWGAVGLVILVLLGLDVRDRLAFGDATESLQNEPGWVVLDADRGWRGWSFEVLRDPLARSESILKSEAMARDSGNVTILARPFESTDSAIVIRRVESYLPPHPSTELALGVSTLLIQGTVDPEWLVQIERDAPLLAGITDVEFRGERARPAGFDEAADRLEAFRMPFAAGAATAGATELAELVGMVAQLGEVLDRGVDPAIIRVIGSADPATGSTELNRQLALRRAEGLIAAIDQPGDLVLFEAGIELPDAVDGPTAQFRVVRFEVQRTP